MSTVNAKPSTKREQREASNEKILKSALRLFVSKGFRSTTVDDIAHAAGLTKGAVYFYFKSKSAVLLALLDEIEHILVDEITTRVGEAGPSEVDKLVAFVHGEAVLGVDKAEFVLLFILMLIEFNGSENDVQRRIAAIYEKRCRAVEEILRRGIRGGEFRDDVSAKEAAAIVIAMHNGTLLEWYCRPKELRGRELVRALRKTLLEGIVKA
jgi:AcrR family transcriptional regulator